MSKAKTRVKAGTNKPAAAARRKEFVAAYLTNGRNGTQAAITAGYSPKTAKNAASRLLADVNVSAAVNKALEKAEAVSGLTVERTLQEVARVAYQDTRRFYDEQGNLKAIRDLDDDTAACLAGVEVTEEFEGAGSDRKSVGYTKKLKFWDKNAALEKAMRHLGLYEKDNRQRGADLALQVVLMGPA